MTAAAIDIRQFVVETFLFGQGADGLSDDASFLETGIIDSTGVLELIAFLEERYGIAVVDEDLLPENFDSVNRVAAFVSKKLAS